METLFPMPEGEPLPRAASLERGGTPVWTRIRPTNHVPCDECILVLHENKGKGPYPRGARWSRRVGIKKTFLCHEHAGMWRADDKNRT